MKAFAAAAQGDVILKPPAAAPSECDEREEDVERGNWVPQIVQGFYEDTDGIKHAAVIVALTGGVANSDTSKIEVSTINNGHSIVVSEDWNDEMTNMDLFYSNVEKKEDETDDDVHLRRFAMIKAVRQKLQDSRSADTIKSEWYTRLPFQADPTTLKHEIIGNDEGSRFLHIDLTERKRVKIGTIKMINKAKEFQTPKKPKVSSF